MTQDYDPPVLPDRDKLLAAEGLLETAREAQGRGETKTVKKILAQVERLLETAWPVLTPWAQHRPW